jgi:hypothetical protein
MNDTSPLAGFLALTVLSSLAALAAGALMLGGVFAAAAIASGTCIRQNAVRTKHPRPVIRYLSTALPQQPLIRLQPGQFATLPWPHTLQVLLPEGTRLKILESTSDHVRVMAV